MVIRRFFTRVLMVVLLAACGYNWLQVRQLRAEVGDLRTRLAVQSRPPQPATDWPVTEQELRRNARDLKNVLDGVRSPQSQRTLRDLQARTEYLRRQADALWREARSVSVRHSP